MQTSRLDKMVKGWFVGDFDPTVVRTNAAEIAVKHYLAGDYEARHHHKVATEVTVIVSGEVMMNDVKRIAGDIIVIEPGESSDFRVLVDTTTVVVKLPSFRNDKYEGDS